MKKIIVFIILLSMISCLLSGCSLWNLSAGFVTFTMKKGFKYGDLPKDFYEKEEVLLSTEDKYFTRMYSCTPEKSRMNIELKDYSGFRTMAYFYKYNNELSVHRISISYQSQLKSGKCKLIIISPSKEIVKTISFDDIADADIDLKESGKYYLRVVGENATGEVEFNATGLSVIYKFMQRELKGGLYDYEE